MHFHAAYFGNSKISVCEGHAQEFSVFSNKHAAKNLWEKDVGNDHGHVNISQVFSIKTND